MWVERQRGWGWFATARARRQRPLGRGALFPFVTLNPKLLVARANVRPTGCEGLALSRFLGTARVPSNLAVPAKSHEPFAEFWIPQYVRFPGT